MDTHRDKEGRLAPAPNHDQGAHEAGAGSGECSETAVPPHRPVRRRPIDVAKDDSGLLVVNIDKSLTGALRVCARRSSAMRAG